MSAAGPPPVGSSRGVASQRTGSATITAEPGQSPAQPEVLALGAGAPDHRLRKGLVVLVVLLGLVAVGLVVWRLIPRPDPPMTLAELQGVYAGMVRSDGVNDAAVIKRPDPPARGTGVDPTGCMPLFDTTTFNQFPIGALDGVGTYWLVEPSAISLFTFRFPDASVAETAYRRVADALNACAGHQVAVSQPSPASGRLSRTQTPRTDAGEQVGYLFAIGPRTRFAVQVLEFDNTVTWQYRYEAGPLDYSTVSAQQLMDSLGVQMRSVLALRGR